nr:uncharacterized protein LOC106027120 [Cavia porcellus]
MVVDREGKEGLWSGSNPSGPIRSCCAPPLPTPHLLPLQVRLQLPLTLTFRAAAGLEVGGLGRGALGTRLTVGDASRARSLSGPGHESRRSIYEFAGAQAPAAHSCQARKDRPPRGDGLPRQPAPGPTGWAGPRRPTPTGPPPPQGGAQEGARGGLELPRSRLPAGHRLNPAPPRPPRASIKPEKHFHCSRSSPARGSISLYCGLQHAHLTDEETEAQKGSEEVSRRCQPLPGRKSGTHLGDCVLAGRVPLGKEPHHSCPLGALPACHTQF